MRAKSVAEACPKTRVAVQRVVDRDTGNAQFRERGQLI
jgi:hypothetical protein